jgi:hypothetical protein
VLWKYLQGILAQAGSPAGTGHIHHTTQPAGGGRHSAFRPSLPIRNRAFFYNVEWFFLPKHECFLHMPKHELGTLGIQNILNLSFYKPADELKGKYREILISGDVTLWCQ